jgi:hypothetical protein
MGRAWCCTDVRGFEIRTGTRTGTRIDGFLVQGSDMIFPSRRRRVAIEEVQIFRWTR